jgi:hypothetical protein
MSIPTYTLGYPPDGSSLGQTKATIRNNLDGTFETLGVDHINNNGSPGMQPAGYHNVIRSVPQGSDPTKVSGYGQLYSKKINDVANDEALFWRTGEGGLIQQLTVNLTPLASTNGYTFLPGGFIMQWGTVANTADNTGGSQSYPLAFPTAVLSLQATPTWSGTTGLGNVPTNRVTTFIAPDPANLLTKFKWWMITGGATNITGFYWTAIGY